jgi:phage shock protein A
VLVAERPDWIALTPKTVLAQVVSAQLLKPEQVARETAQVRQETTRLNSEQKQLLENTTRLQQEVSQLKQEVTTLKQAPAAPIAKKAVAPAPAVNAATSSVEQRLLTLQQLRDKQLITEQEYQQRRLKILDSL